MSPSSPPLLPPGLDISFGIVKIDPKPARQEHGKNEDETWKGTDKNSLKKRNKSKGRSQKKAAKKMMRKITSQETLVGKIEDEKIDQAQLFSSPFQAEVITETRPLVLSNELSSISSTVTRANVLPMANLLDKPPTDLKRHDLESDKHSNDDDDDDNVDKYYDPADGDAEKGRWGSKSAPSSPTLCSQSNSEMQLAISSEELPMLSDILPAVKTIPFEKKSKSSRRASFSGVISIRESGWSVWRSPVQENTCDDNVENVEGLDIRDAKVGIDEGVSIVEMKQSLQQTLVQADKIMTDIETTSVGMCGNVPQFCNSKANADGMDLITSTVYVESSFAINLKEEHTTTQKRKKVKKNKKKCTKKEKCKQIDAIPTKDIDKIEDKSEVRGLNILEGSIMECNDLHLSDETEEQVKYLAYSPRITSDSTGSTLDMILTPNASLRKELSRIMQRGEMYFEQVKTDNDFKEVITGEILNKKCQFRILSRHESSQWHEQRRKMQILKDHPGMQQGFTPMELGWAGALNENEEEVMNNVALLIVLLSQKGCATIIRDRRLFNHYPAGGSSYYTQVENTLGDMRLISDEEARFRRLFPPERNLNNPNLSSGEEPEGNFHHGHLHMLAEWITGTASISSSGSSSVQDSNIRHLPQQEIPEDKSKCQWCSDDGGQCGHEDQEIKKSFKRFKRCGNNRAKLAVMKRSNGNAKKMGELPLMVVKPVSTLDKDDDKKGGCNEEEEKS